MAAVLRLSLRQIAGFRRLLVVGALALLPIVAALLLRDNAAGTDGRQDSMAALIDSLLAGAVLPIATMALATRTFGNDLEDRTLSFIALTPIARWRIALPKLAASVLIAAPLVLGSGIVTAWIGSGGDLRTVAAVCAGLLTGVAAYAALFTWAGLVTVRALPFAVIYAVLWEGVVSSQVSGVRYLSIRSYALSVMHAADAGAGLGGIANRLVDLPVALAAAAVLVTGFLLLTVHRLKRMDVP